MIYENMMAAIGRTPLVKLKSFDPQAATIYAKIEKNNPSGSIKDRAVQYMIQDLLESGQVEVGGTIVEATSGNTGIGLAMAGAVLGIKVVIVMPESMSMERRMLMQAYGAELVLTPAAGGMQAANDKAEAIAKERGGIVFGQFIHPANALAHQEGTAQEILADLPDVAGFVAGAGTGGTVTGVSRGLKAEGRSVQVWTVEPETSPLLTKGQAGSHQIQGIGANFVPEVLDLSLVDRVVTVSNEAAIEEAVNLGKTQGILAGISSGANLVAAKQMALELGAGQKIVVIFPDSGERYLSTGYYGDGQEH